MENDDLSDNILFAYVLNSFSGNIVNLKIYLGVYTSQNEHVCISILAKLLLAEQCYFFLSLFFFRIVFFFLEFV